jgi:putative ABC transport system ATP-binding protein
MSIVQVRNLTRTYKQGSLEVQALRGVDLDIEAGEFTALMGPSGSGKTTLLNQIGALDVPDGGSVKVEGRELAGMSKGELARLRLDRLGFVFQAYNLVPVLSAYENAEFVLLLQGVPLAERRTRVMALLGEVGLEGMENRRPTELSGGQQQRVAVARAIAAKPALVLADEVTANLDSATSEELLDTMEALNRDRGITFLFATHDPRVRDRARRVITLVDGKVHSDEKR